MQCIIAIKKTLDSFLNIMLAWLGTIAEEFSKTHLTPAWDLSYDERLKPAKIPTDTPPDSYDWRDHDAVTPVKNQVQTSDDEYESTVIWIYFIHQTCVTTLCHKKRPVLHLLISLPNVKRF